MYLNTEATQFTGKPTNRTIFHYKFTGKGLDRKFVASTNTCNPNNGKVVREYQWKVHSGYKVTKEFNTTAASETARKMINRVCQLSYEQTQASTPDINLNQSTNKPSANKPKVYPRPARLRCADIPYKDISVSANPWAKPLDRDNDGIACESTR